MNTSSLLDNFESEIKSVLNAEYEVSVNSRSSYLAICDNVSISLADDNGIIKKEIAWSFDTLQGDYQVDVVAQESSSSHRHVWRGKGMSARQAYQNLSKRI